MHGQDQGFFLDLRKAQIQQYGFALEEKQVQHEGENQDQAQGL